MTPPTLPQALTDLARACCVDPRRWSGETLRVYVSNLRSLPEGAVLAAIRRLQNDWEHPGLLPTVAQIRKATSREIPKPSLARAREAEMTPEERERSKEAARRAFAEVERRLGRGPMVKEMPKTNLDARRRELRRQAAALRRGK